MAVNEKIKEAEYFLDKIGRATEREEFNPNFNAFLSATKSISDYLLEDYNVKYGLGISFLNSKTFKDKACDKRNLKALDFIESYNSKLEELRKDKIINFMISKRNITVHKTNIHLQKNANVSIIDDVNKGITISNTTFKWLFDDDDYKEVDVVESCQKFLQSMKDFVKKLKTDFP